MKREDVIQDMSSILVCKETGFLNWDKAQELAERLLGKLELIGFEIVEGYDED